MRVFLYTTVIWCCTTLGFSTQPCSLVHACNDHPLLRSYDMLAKVSPVIMSEDCTASRQLLGVDSKLQQSKDNLTDGLERTKPSVKEDQGSTATEIRAKLMVDLGRG